MDSRQQVGGGSDRKGKRKHEDYEAEQAPAAPPNALAVDVQALVEILRTATSTSEEDRVAARRAAHAIADLAKHEENVDTIVEEGAVEALVPHLSPSVMLDEGARIPCENEVEKDTAFALGLLAVKPEHQRLIADAGALQALVALLKLALLKRKGMRGHSRSLNAVVRRAADAITNLAHENASIKNRVRCEGGIPPLVALLESNDSKVQRAAAGALRTLAFKNEDNKKQIVDGGALPTLIFMLRSEDIGIHYEAVGVIGNLVHSSNSIKIKVLAEGALQPVIGLLSSRCKESQREAALLLGQFATTEEQQKVKIVQRGAVKPLIRMLEAGDPQLREMAAFALGRLAQDSNNQAGIVHDGGLRPLLELLDSKNGSLQHNAAFALYGLADNPDNVADIVKEGGVQQLMDSDLTLQQSKDCVQKTLKRLEEKLSPAESDEKPNSRLVLKYLLYLMRLPEKTPEKTVQRRVATALAHLCSEDDQRYIFLESGGLEVLLEMIVSSRTKEQRDAAVGIYVLAKKAAALSPIDAAPPPDTPQIYIGEQYVNSTTLSDVTFVVEGTRFYAHRIALLASSEAFRAMFDGGYKEKDAKDIEIPNISWKVFEAMMRCIYAGNVEVTQEIAQDLLRAADQYLLEGLKRQCEEAIAKSLTKENVASVFELAETYHAQSLRQTCVLFALEFHDEMCTFPGHTRLLERMVPEMRDYMIRILRPRPSGEKDAAQCDGHHQRGMEHSKHNYDQANF